MTSKRIYSLSVTLILLATGFTGLVAQYLVSIESLGMRSMEQIEAIVGMEVRTSVTLYKVHYMTTDAHDMPDTASGLLVYPETPITTTHPLVVYQHGTTDGPNDAPSRLAAGSAEAMGYGGMGYVCVAPDYLGLGDNDGFHPYVHAATEASAGLDMLFAAAEWLDQETGDSWIGEIFVSGYSQGGHAAAALQRELEANWSLIFPVTASTPMSGPYSMAGVMYDRIISDEIYLTPAYIVYFMLGYQEVYGNLYTDLTEVFEAPYLPYIQQFRDGQLSTFTMNSYLVGLLFGNGGLMPKLMFVDSYLEAIINDEDHPVRVALRANDLTNWVPQVPTRLYYCTADEQVPYRNAIVADSIMTANGAPDVEAENFGELTHGGCAPLAIEASIAFFDSFLLPSDVKDIHTHEVAFVKPNPARNTLYLDKNFSTDISEIQFYNTKGQLISSVNPYGNQVDISGMSTGVYIVVAKTGDALLRQKIVITQ